MPPVLNDDPVDLPMNTQIFLTVNGVKHELSVRNDRTLLDALHDDIGTPDVRYGCGEGVCGTCTILMNDEPVSACLMYADQAQGAEITTLAGLTQDEELHPMQKCFLQCGASHCALCTPGVTLTASARCKQNADATREDVRYELVGNLCRCTGYTKILDAVEEYLGEVREDVSTGGSN